MRNYQVLKKYFLLFCIFLLINVHAKEHYEIEKLFQETQGVIWGMTFLSNDKLLFTLKSGKIGLYDLKSQKVSYIDKKEVLYMGQGGLLDVQASPNFLEDNYLYFTYVKRDNRSGTVALARAKFKNNHLENWTDIFISKASSKTTRHFGSRITFDDKGYLYMSIGDRGVRLNAQNRKNHAGSILRLKLDGMLPHDNPFNKEKSSLPQIYSYGHRNPQGLFFDKERQLLFSSEHGPRGGDEINLIEKGANYGWPVISYGKEYWSPLAVGIGTHKKGMQQPLKVYTPSIAPSSLLVYSGDKFLSWKGSLFIGALKMRHLNRIVLNDKYEVVEEERLFEDLGERIRQVIQSPEGNIYFSTDSGAIYKVFKD